MDQIERRAFMKGAGIGALAFTVGGAEVLLTPGAARAQGVPFRLLNAKKARPSRRWARRWCPARARPALRISSTTRSQCRRRRRCCRRASSTCVHRLRISIAPPSARLTAAARRSPAGNLRRCRRPISAISSTICARTRSKAGPDRAEGSSTRILRSDAVDVVYGTMEGYAALGIPYQAHIVPTKRW